MKSGSSRASSGRNSLGKRDRSILSDVIRYRLTTNEIVQSRYLPTAVPNAVSKITSRLANTGWLTRRSLFDNRTYFTPSRQLCMHFGLPISRSRPLGAQTLATALSIANYCQLSSPGHQLLDAKDYASAWTWIPQKLRTLPGAVDSHSDTATLRLVRVDLGGSPDHVASKCAHDIKIRCNLESFRNLLNLRRLVVVVLTTTDNKRLLIMRAIQKRSWPENTRFEVVVISDLFPLLIV